MVGEQLRHRDGDRQPARSRADQQQCGKARRHRGEHPAEQGGAGDGVPDDGAEQPLVRCRRPEVEEWGNQVDTQRTRRQERKQSGNQAQEQRGNSHRLFPRWSLLRPRGRSMPMGASERKPACVRDAL